LNKVKVRYTGGESGWKGDVPRFLLDTKKISKLGWKPKRSSKEAVREAARIVVRERLKKSKDSWLSETKW
jgi:UDP-glucose 4-epimerase